MMKTYYNEFDKQKCAMLSQLMKDGHITKGDIDDRSIKEVQPEDIKGYTRCHFFAGIGLWDYALNLAGWEDDKTVWTGSCPCQPFSTAGRQKGKTDDRHLWPEWFRLIKECHPSTIFGEQVANAVAKGWLDDVYQGLEAEDYAVGSVVLPACSVGAPHKRDRLWFVANREVLQRSNSNLETREMQRKTPKFREGSLQGAMGNTSSTRPQRHGGFEQEHGSQGWKDQERHPWQTGVCLNCPDGKQRLIEPSIPLLVDGDAERVGIIHAAGDAIVSQVAAEFIKAYTEVDK